MGAGFLALRDEPEPITQYRSNLLKGACPKVRFVSLRDVQHTDRIAYADWYKPLVKRLAVEPGIHQVRLNQALGINNHTMGLTHH